MVFSENGRSEAPAYILFLWFREWGSNYSAFPDGRERPSLHGHSLQAGGRPNLQNIERSSTGQPRAAVPTWALTESYAVAG
jgi:hypothetical protein